MNILELPVEEGGERLDRWLAVQVPNLSRARLQRLILQGQVWLNGEVCTSKHETLTAGDVLEVVIPDPAVLDLQPQAIPLDILYEDDQLLVLNKPAGLVVHPAPGHADGTLVNALLAHCPHLPGIGEQQRPGIVHRLDKDTTGAMMVAKTDLAHQALQEQLRTRSAKREYLGLVHGAPSVAAGILDAPLGRHPKDRLRMAVVERGGRPAVTHWQIQERLGPYTLVQFRLETGRTHQIRVHCQHWGHPIVGDPLYSRGGRPAVHLPGQALHAWRLTLFHPVSGERLVCTAPLPDAFEKLLHRLRGMWGE